tara:strand:+ start:256 stop:1254 length:999 start_codon:yes stop_codon:yes gene_type:complete
MKKILVTGANGYIAKHIISELYKKNYLVKGTLRNLAYSDTVKKDTERHIGREIKINFAKASLDSDYGWNEAVEGCDAVIHAASPFPIKSPKNEDDLILPAKEGTLRVLNAAAGKAIDRIILTSSNAAVYDGNRKILKFNENIWTNINSKGVNAYTKSKTIAEKSAWDFASSNQNIKLTTINPVLVWGPGIGNHRSSASLNIFKMLIDRKIPMIPRIKIPLVDVRDVAKAHVDSIENANSIDKRFLLCESTRWMKDVALKMKSLGYNPPTKVAPNFIIKFLALFDSTLRAAATKVDYNYDIDSNQAKTIIGFSPMPLDRTLRDTYNYIKNINN